LRKTIFHGRVSRETVRGGSLAWNRLAQYAVTALKIFSQISRHSQQSFVFLNNLAENLSKPILNLVPNHFRNFNSKIGLPGISRLRLTSSRTFGVTFFSHEFFF
jgi:hypothetical protein